MAHRFPSVYTPQGAFAYMMAVLLLALVAGLVYLAAFTGASVPF
ncbi:hypothetical protein SAMN05444422_104152 [Halobiforma haloterrestris]|uniref:Uncharacterized protein n=1 Tax=Natronobacterium haloterrestre TaxID=148448 RepID=A0A1I1GF99_NATHA|nr:hypothetical protein [Halobiforma haloterrestris]SFC07840.1 hypothetical protein SAMN05444422_104152 [Halobiforma haloterrestris]